MVDANPNKKGTEREKESFEEVKYWEDRRIDNSGQSRNSKGAKEVTDGYKVFQWRKGIQLGIVAFAMHYLERLHFQKTPPQRVRGREVV